MVKPELLRSGSINKRVELLIDDQLYTFEGYYLNGELNISYYNCTHTTLMRNINMVRETLMAECAKDYEW